MFFIERNVEVIMDIERQNSLISAVHSSLGMSLTSRAQAYHLRRDKCYSTLQEHYSFPMMRQHVQMYIKYCEPCQLQNSRKLQKCPYILKSIPVLTKCFSKLGVDLIGPLKPSSGKQYIISCVDYFSKYIEAKSIQNKTGSEATTFLHKFICRCGVMDITITDQGNYHSTSFLFVFIFLFLFFFVFVFLVFFVFLFF